jgi:phosphatidylinositol-3-phosphatase
MEVDAVLRGHVRIAPVANPTAMKKRWHSLAIVLAAVLGANAGAPAAGSAAAVAPHATHVTVVVLENRNYDLVVGNAHAPYFNKTLIPGGVLLQNSHAIGHPSEPNYLELFSGSNQGVTNDSCPHTFRVKNIGAELVAIGKTFAGFAESMPQGGFAGCWGSRGLYARKHVPWANFPSVPASSSLVYSGLPATVPSLAFIVPNMCNDMHDCSTATGDDWMRKNLAPIVAWDAKNDGLLIVTWDEADPDDDGTNHIPTVLVGPMIKPGTSQQHVDQYGVLHTIETIFAVPCFANECTSTDIKDIWQ